MLVQLKHVLGPGELTRVNELLDGAQFVDGKLSAGKAAAPVKNNQEIISSDPRIEQLNQIVMGNLVRHPTYQKAALPLRIAQPFYAVYSQGMAYGEHIDDPVMGPANTLEARYRSDIAVTIFLNAPDEYDGGELSIQTEFGLQEIKYAAGDAVLYPTTTRHQVKEVTNGTRKVAVTWVQSMIRDPGQRAVLYELAVARDRLLRKAPDEESTKQVDHAYVNLVRMWSEV